MTARIVTCALSLSALLSGGCAMSGSADSPDVANPLIDESPTVVFENEGTVILSWELRDSPELWEEEPARLPHLEAWRSEIRHVVGGTDPESLLRRNREVNSWLETENPDQRVINDRVLRGELGRWRPMNVLESWLLDFHAGRYPLFDNPSEMGVLILSRGTPDSESIRLYYLSDGRNVPPQDGAARLLEIAADDLRAGWDARVLLHNHTFDLTSDRGLLAIAAPSESDMQFLRAIRESLGVEQAWIIDGFNSFEVNTSELE